MANRPDSPPDSLFKRFKASAAAMLHKLLAIHGAPHEVALGFALGIFIGMMPVMGFHIVIAIFFTTLLGCNKLSAVLAVWITNPVTAPFIYGMNYMIGVWLLGLKNNLHIDFNMANLLHLLEKAPSIFWALTVGGVVVGLPLAALGYLVIYILAVRYQDEIRYQVALQKELLLRKKRRMKKSLKKKVEAMKRRKSTAKKRPQNN